MIFQTITEVSGINEDKAKEIVAMMMADGMPESEALRMMRGERVVKTGKDPKSKVTSTIVYQLLPEPNEPEKPKLILASKGG